LSEGAGFAALVDLGVRQGIITPVTSIYVPTSSEMTPAQREQARAESRRRAGRNAAADALVQEAKKAERKREAEETEKDDEDESLLGGLLKSKSKSDKGRADDAQDSKRDNKEGGTGTRAKGEDGKMAEPTPNEVTAAPTAAATAAAPPTQVPQIEPAKPGYRMEADKLEEKPAAPKEPPTDAAPATPDATNGDGSFDQPTPKPAARPTSGAEQRGPTGGGGRGSGSGSGEGLKNEASKTITQAENIPFAPKATEEQHNRWSDDDGESDLGGEAERRSQKQQVVITIDNPGRLLKPCGPGADLPFEERRALWRERLATSGGAATNVYNIYRSALALCEAPTVRERRALLLLGLDVLPGVAQKVALYRLLARDMGAADIVYRGILARVTTPAQVRELNQALGLVAVDSATLEKTVKEAKDPSDLAQKLRALASKFPNDLALALRVLDALEDAGEDAVARETARALRARPDADAAVRTAVGELYLRLAARGTDAAQKAVDEREAKRTFGELVEFSPEDPALRRRLGDLYRAHGYYQEASRQYETLARLVPDDPTVPILLATAANGLGKLEEAVRWTEKGGQAGAPDASQGPHATARAYAAAFLAWGRLEARAAGKKDEVTALQNRLDRVLGSSGLDKREGQIRVLLTWAHPELHPTLWHDGLGSLMPASEGDATLGIAQAMVPDKGAGNRIDVRIDPTEVERTARLGQKAVLTVVVGEGKDAEVVERVEVSFTREGPATQSFRIGDGKVEKLPPPATPAAPGGAR
jgi:Ca-activated chloride channel family protein